MRANDRLALLLPSTVVQAIGIRAGDLVEVTAGNGAIVIRRARRLSLHELVRRITPENRHRAIHWETTGRESC